MTNTFKGPFVRCQIRIFNQEMPLVASIWYVSVFCKLSYYVWPALRVTADFKNLERFNIVWNSVTPFPKMAPPLCCRSLVSHSECGQPEQGSVGGVISAGHEAACGRCLIRGTDRQICSSLSLSDWS